MFGLGMGEILIILVFALIVLGPKKLPEIAKSIGKGLREFQRAKDGIMDDFRRSTDTNPPPTQALPPQNETRPADPEQSTNPEESSIKKA